MDWIEPFITKSESFSDEVERVARNAEQRALARQLNEFAAETSRWLTHGKIKAFYREFCERDDGRER